MTDDSCVQETGTGVENTAALKALGEGGGKERRTWAPITHMLNPGAAERSVRC